MSDQITLRTEAAMCLGDLERRLQVKGIKTQGNVEKSPFDTNESYRFIERLACPRLFRRFRFGRLSGNDKRFFGLLKAYKRVKDLSTFDFSILVLQCEKSPRGLPPLPVNIAKCTAEDYAYIRARGIAGDYAYVGLIPNPHYEAEVRESYDRRINNNRAQREIISTPEYLIYEDVKLKISNSSSTCDECLGYGYTYSSIGGGVPPCMSCNGTGTIKRDPGISLEHQRIHDDIAAKLNVLAALKPFEASLGWLAYAAIRHDNSKARIN